MQRLSRFLRGGGSQPHRAVSGTSFDVGLLAPLRQSRSSLRRVSQAEDQSTESEGVDVRKQDRQLGIMWRCNGCLEFLPIDYYHLNHGLETPRSKCKRCRLQEQIGRVRSTRRYERNWFLQKRYGITADQYDEMLVQQQALCAICETDTPRGQGRFHVDHNHDTGAIRGLLCLACNAMLGNARDSTDILGRAIAYLDACIPCHRAKTNEQRERGWT